MQAIIVYKDMSTKKVKTKDTRTYENDPDWLQTITARETVEVSCSSCDRRYLLDIGSGERTPCPWCNEHTLRIIKEMETESTRDKNRVKTAKLAEKVFIVELVRMATESLDPDSYTALLDIMTRLAKTRNIDWKPF
jgi:hypothetical protein